MDTNIINNNLYFPISDKKITQLLYEKNTKADIYQSLQSYEIASLLILTYIADNVLPNPILEKKLAELISMGNQSHSSGNSFIDEVVSKINLQKINGLLSNLSDTGLYLLPENEIQDEEFLNPDKSWSYTFKSKYSHPSEEKIYTYSSPSGEPHAFRSEQFRTFNEMYKNLSGEHLQIEGVAGSGKTRTITLLVQELQSLYRKSRKNVLVLANKYDQVMAIKAKLSKRVPVLTFGQYAEKLLLDNQVTGVTLANDIKTRLTLPWDYNHIASELRFQQINKLSAYDVARSVIHMIFNFCTSEDDEISEKHSPKWLDYLTSEQEAALTAQANLLWELIKNAHKQRDLNLPMRVAFMIKIASLNELKPSANIAHIVVDEGHDLTPAVVKLLNTGTHALTVLGDKFQAIFQAPARVNNALERTLSYSFRVPKGHENWVSTLLGHHPNGGLAAFNGNKERKAEVSYYSSPNLETLDNNTAIFVKDDWELVEFIHKLAVVQRPYVLIGEKRQLESLGLFVKSLIDLFTGNSRATHIVLARYLNWDKLAFSFRQNRAFNHVSKMLEKGYSMRDWDDAAKLYDANAKIALGVYEQAKNREYPNVMLAPSVIDLCDEVSRYDGINTKEALFKRREMASKLYLGITRSERKIIVPTHFESFFRM